MYIEASVAPDCRSARNNLYSGISLVRQVRSLISLPCSVSLCFWSFLVSDPVPFPVPFPVSDSVSFPVSFPVSDSVSFPVPFPVSNSVPFPVPFPVPFSVSDSVPRSSVLDRLPFRFPFRIPFRSCLHRGSASRCFSLCSRAALLYIEGSA